MEHDLSQHWAICDWIKSEHRRRSIAGQPRVYFIQGAGSGLIKIGFASNLKQRLSALKTGSPVPLTILAHRPGDEEEEAWLHSQLAAHRAHGEWFQPHEDVLRHVRFALRFPQQMPIAEIPRWYRKARLAVDHFMPRYNLSEDDAFELTRGQPEMLSHFDWHRHEQAFVLADYAFAQAHGGMA